MCSLSFLSLGRLRHGGAQRDLRAPQELANCCRALWPVTGAKTRDHRRLLLPDDSHTSRWTQQVQKMLMRPVVTSQLINAWSVYAKIKVNRILQVQVMCPLLCYCYKKIRIHQNVSNLSISLLYNHLNIWIFSLVLFSRFSIANVFTALLCKLIQCAVTDAGKEHPRRLKQTQWSVFM